MELVYRNDDDKRVIGEKIRVAREAARLSQGDLADIMGTSSNVVYRHENGTREMGVGAFFQYADALHLDPVALFPDRYKEKTADGRRELASITAGLDDADIEVLLTMARHLQNRQ